MKVLLITHIYPPAVDGGSKVIYKFGQYLQDHGHQIKVITSDCHSTDDFSRLYYPITENNPNIFRLPVIVIFHRPLKLLSRIFHNLCPYSKGPLFSPFIFFRVLFQIRRFQPDLIVAGPLPTTIVLYARLLKSLTGSKLIINASFHPTDPDFQVSTLINCLKSADYLWTLTDYESNYFQKNFKISPSKIINVGNGIDTNLIQSCSTPTNHQILYIGAFAAHKGIDTLIRSLSLNPKLKLVLAGQTTLYYPQLKKQIDALSKDLKKNISLFISPSDRLLTNLIDQSDIVVLPSRQESFGLVLLEAWARGKPVITSDIPQLMELISKTQGGLTFKLDDVVSLNRQINRLCQSRALRHRLGKNGLQFVKSHYTWDKIGDSLCSKIGC